MAPSTSGSGGRLGDDGRLAHPPGHLERLADHAPQLLQVERLEQVVEGPLLHRLDGRVGRLGQVMKMTGMRASMRRICW